MTHQEFLKEFPKYLASYKPAPDVLAQIGGIKLVMIIGPSGVGKTTIINNLGLPFVLSDVTRPRRPEEKDGVDYHFREDYEQIIAELQSGRFVQVALSPDGELYTTRASSYPTSGLAAMAIVSDVVPIVRRLGFGQTISVFIMPPGFEEWMRRMKVHEMDETQKAKRLAEAKRSLKFALADQQMNFILNDDIQKAVGQIKDLLNGKIDQKRENLARHAAEESIGKIS